MNRAIESLQDAVNQLHGIRNTGMAKSSIEYAQQILLEQQIADERKSHDESQDQLREHLRQSMQEVERLRKRNRSLVSYLMECEHEQQVPHLSMFRPDELNPDSEASDEA